MADHLDMATLGHRLLQEAMAKPAARFDDEFEATFVRGQMIDPEARIVMDVEDHKDGDDD